MLDLAGRIRRQRADAGSGVDIDPHDLPTLELAYIGADRADDPTTELDGLHDPRLDSAAEWECLGADVNARLLGPLKRDHVAKHGQEHSCRYARCRTAALHPADDSSR